MAWSDGFIGNISFTRGLKLKGGLSEVNLLLALPCMR